MAAALSTKRFWAAFSDHARHTATAARFLIEMLEDVEQQNPNAETIRKLELRGTDITQRTLDGIEHASVSPLDPEDGHALIRELNYMLVELRCASDRIAMHQMQPIRRDVVALARILASSVDKVLEAVNLLTVVTQVTNQRPLAELCRAIGENKHRAERVLRGASAGLYREVKDPIEIVKWRDILAALGAATSRADGVAHVIEGIAIDRV